MIKRWGMPWYAAGIGGTIVFMALWVITRMPDNQITGRAGPAGNPAAIAIAVCPAAFIGLAAAVLAYEARARHASAQKAADKPSSRKHTTILAGIVVALVLIGSLALPATMQRPSGLPPGQGPQGKTTAGPSAQDAPAGEAGMLIPLMTELG
jgi:hypothetical protein